jgi:hypothetical protein
MDPDELDDAVTTLQQERQTLRADLDKLRTEYDRTARAFEQLSQKLRYPGTKFLVELEYKLVYEVTTSIGPGSVVVVPTVGTPAFETLPGTLHAVYVLSAYAPDSDTPVVVMDGSVIAPPANTVSIGIQRQRQSSPLRIEARLILDNAGGGTHNVTVRVWRRLGMGS